MNEIFVWENKRQMPFLYDGVKENLDSLSASYGVSGDLSAVNCLGFTGIHIGRV